MRKRFFRAFLSLSRFLLASFTFLSSGVDGKWFEPVVDAVSVLILVFLMDTLTPELFVKTGVCSHTGSMELSLILLRALRHNSLATITSLAFA